jgi:hypothetical protein
VTRGKEYKIVTSEQQGYIPAKNAYIAIHTDDMLMNKIASLTLALQAAHKGLNRLSKQNKQLKIDLTLNETLALEGAEERGKRIASERTITYLHGRIAELECRLLAKAFQDDHLAD